MSAFFRAFFVTIETPKSLTMRRDNGVFCDYAKDFPKFAAK